MKIRSRITIYFSLTTLVITGVAFVFVYILFQQNRKEEFQVRQKEKITTTLDLLAKIKDTEGKLIEEIDLLTIHDLYDEKLLLFNSNKKLIYSSIDDIPIHYPERILLQLTPENNWVYTKENLYDIVGAYVESNGKKYYGVSKAYDTFGYSKLSYLRNVLIVTFIIISLILILVSSYLSKKITEPLALVTQKISEYNFEENYTPLQVAKSKDEVALLAMQFNKLMKRMNEAFAFQKHAVHHISHELKTPISILVSNFEKIERETDLQKVKAFLKAQKEDTKSLSEIINALLEISKTESLNILNQEKLRIDELIFDVAEELKNIYPDFKFLIEYEPETEDESQLTVAANIRLLKLVLVNLMQNCAQYSSNNTAHIKVQTGVEKVINLVFENKGIPISEKESKYIFQRFFRGENSKGKRGFGLGLVLVHKIILLHKGSITYNSENFQSNIFTVQLPLS